MAHKPLKSPPTAPYVVPNRGRTTLTDAELAQAAYNAGFRGQSLTTAIAVALAESHANTTALNDHGEFSVGMFQINVNGYLANRLKRWGFSSWMDLWDPEKNAAAAYDISHQGQNFGLWSTYKHGTYLKYMTRAQAAANSVGQGGTTGGTQGGTTFPGYNPYPIVSPVGFVTGGAVTTTYSADQWNQVMSCVTGKGHVDTNPHPMQGQPAPGTINSQVAQDIKDCASSLNIDISSINLDDYIGKTLSDVRDALASLDIIPGPDPLGMNGLTAFLKSLRDSVSHAFFFLVIIIIGLVILLAGMKARNKGSDE
jgi:hypothetical protein